MTSKLMLLTSGAIFAAAVAIPASASALLPLDPAALGAQPEAQIILADHHGHDDDEHEHHGGGLFSWLGFGDHDDDGDCENDGRHWGDDDDDDEGGCMGAMNAAPAGTATPPDNGLFANGAEATGKVN